jgi:hypothetical protein
MPKRKSVNPTDLVDSYLVISKKAGDVGQAATRFKNSRTLKNFESLASQLLDLAVLCIRLFNSLKEEVKS